MTELWVPSDDLIVQDTIAKAKLDNPFEPDDLEVAGIVLPEPDSDEAALVLAAVALAEEDDSQPDQPCMLDDDDVIEDAEEEGVAVPA